MTGSDDVPHDEVPHDDVPHDEVSGDDVTEIRGSTGSFAGDSERVRNDLLAAWLGDRDAGLHRGVADYQAMFPGHEDVVAEELAELLGGETESYVEPPDGEAPPYLDIPDVEILYRIGQGGQGVVYRGRQQYLVRDVAVKVIAPSTWCSAFASRLRREAESLAQLRHPNIVTCFVAGTTDAGVGYIVMEFVDGPNLRAWVKEHGPLSETDAISLCRDLAAALQHACEANIIHRDVKPENILLRTLPKTDGGLPFEVKLTDLGLARPTDRGVGELTQLTPVNAVLGSPLTMAPEQFDDPDAVDFRADIYGLGCVLYFALAGRSAFESNTLTGAIRDKLTKKVPDVRQVAPQVSPEVASLVRSMIEPDPDDRPTSHAEVVAECERLLGGEKRPSGRRAALWSAIVVVLLAVAWVVGFDPWGVVYPPAIEISGPATVTEGKRVRIDAVATPSGRDMLYSWAQVGGDTVRLSSWDSRELEFVAPRGKSSPSEFSFEVTVSHLWHSARETKVLVVQPDEAFAPLRPGAVRELLNSDRTRICSDWPGESSRGAWGGNHDKELGAADGSVTGGLTWRSRDLPRGRFELTGALEPHRVWVREDVFRRTERAGIRLEFSCGNSIELSVIKNAAGEGYIAGVRRVPPDMTEESLKQIEFAASTPGSWDDETSMPFKLRWNGSTIEVEWGGVTGSEAPSTRYSIDPSQWPSPYPPSALRILVEDGRACFYELKLRGL